MSKAGRLRSLAWFARPLWGSTRPKKFLQRVRPSGDESGFTLVELLIVVAVMPMIVGALALGIMSVFSLQSQTQKRFANTGDAQAVAVNYRNDVQSAQYVTTQSSSSPQCGTGYQLLGLEWDPNSAGDYQTIVSYIRVTSGSYTELVRNYCVNGSTTPQTSVTVSFNISSTQGAPSITPSSAATTAASGWVSAQSVTAVSFAVSQPESGNGTSNSFQYTLVAAPANTTAPATSGGPLAITTLTSCGTATSGGTYVNQLCFIDFSILNNAADYAAATDTNSCLQMSASVPGNNTMFFCVHISGGYVAAVPFPTYSAAFLGNDVNNQPFYYGVPGDPAVYQPYGHNGETPTTVTLSNISVVNSQGVDATGWEAIAADAETTDAGEQISFSSNKALNLLYNSPTSAVGNACGQSGGTTINSAYLSGIGTTTVTCAPPSNEPNTTKTGTAMVWAAEPTTMSVTLNGGSGGLEGLAFGLLVS